MKIFAFIVVIFAVTGFAQCKKADITRSRNAYRTPDPAPGPPVPTRPSNTAPLANAGGNRVIYAPTDSVVLRGSARAAENSIRSIAWRQLPGPTAAVLHTPSDPVTLVTNLKAGIYNFELTVTDSAGRSGSSRATVYVEDEFKPEKEIKFENLTWIFPWYASLEIPDIYKHVPDGARIRVYVKRAASPVWNEATPAHYGIEDTSYEYFIEKRPDGAGMYHFGSLYIFSYARTATTDAPAVRIMY